MCMILTVLVRARVRACAIRIVRERVALNVGSGRRPARDAQRDPRQRQRRSQPHDAAPMRAAWMNNTRYVDVQGRDVPRSGSLGPG